MDPTASPTELTLADQTFQAYPFRDLDHETLNKWVRRHYMNGVKDSIQDDPDLQSAALDNIATMEWQRGIGLRVAMTTKGIYKIACLMCRNQRIPEELCTTIEALEAIMDTFRELHPIENGEASEGDDEAPK